MTKHTITYHTFNGKDISFHTDSYIVDAGFVKFYDAKKDIFKALSVLRCEIESSESESK